MKSLLLVLALALLLASVVWNRTRWDELDQRVTSVEHQTYVCRPLPDETRICGPEQEEDPR